MQAKKLTNVHNPFADNNDESPSAPSSGYTNDNHNSSKSEVKDERPVDPNNPYANEPSILEGKSKIIFIRDLSHFL